MHEAAGNLSMEIQSAFDQRDFKSPIDREWADHGFLVERGHVDQFHNKQMRPEITDSTAGARTQRDVVTPP